MRGKEDLLGAGIHGEGLKVWALPENGGPFTNMGLKKKDIFQ